MKENIRCKEVRNDHRICDAQKHLLQVTGTMMEESIDHEISIE